MRKKQSNKISKPENSLYSILLRYLIIVIVAIPNLYLFYLFFTPLTIYPVFLLLKMFDSTILSGTQIFFGAINIEIINSCVAGSAYYLLFLLNLAIPNIPLKKRFNSILSSFLLLLILNVLRIVFLAILAYNGSDFFDITHKLFWYLLSTLFVVGIWFWEVSYFKIRGIPFYDDLKFLYRQSSFSKNHKRL